MLRAPSFENAAVPLGLALERALPDMRAPHFSVFLRALHPEFPPAGRLLGHPSAAEPLVQATLARGSTLAEADGALAGHLLHFLTTRRIPHARSSPPIQRVLRSLLKSAEITATTYVALLNWLALDTPFNRECRRLLARFADDSVGAARDMTASQRQQTLFALASIIERFPGGKKPFVATLVVVATVDAPALPARQLVACAYSAHVAGVHAREFLERVAEPYIAPELSALTPWDLTHFAVVFDAALPPRALDGVWSALFDECALRGCNVDAGAGGLTLDVSAALLARFVERRQPAEGFTQEQQEARRKWIAVLVEQLLATPPTAWEVRELKRIGAAVKAVLGPESPAAQRLRAAAEVQLKDRWTARKALLGVLGEGTPIQST